ncbi:MAG: agmatinase [Candidatus Micrarchaeia archaeon]
MDYLHSSTPFAFMGSQTDWEDAKVVVLPVPYDSTASYKSGQRHGPNAIIDASRQLELYDIEFAREISKELKFHTLSELQCDKSSPKKVIDALQDTVDKILEEGKFPLIFGGEHSITTGAVQSAFAHYDDLCVLQIDAHADMRDEYEGTKYNHACVMARVREVVPAVSVGIRSYSVSESKIISQKYSDMVFGPALDAKIIDKIISRLNKKNVYITIDIDGFDPAIMSATGTPEPGGLGWYDTLSLLKKVCKEKNVIGADIVELMPMQGQHSSEFACAKLAYKLAGYALLD